MKSNELLRQLPGVDRLLQLPVTLDLIAQYGRPLTTEAVRHTIEHERAAVRAGKTFTPVPAALVQEAREWLEDLLAPTLRPIINATGVIVHTNLGRAPLSRSALDAVLTTAAGYSSLEYDLAAGKRGSRAVHAGSLLAKLTGAEAALVVNNNAAAVLLMLTALCQGKEVIISRGQLIEIGGGFRVPEVMAQSGASLIEVGTTNRTHLRDYEAAITEETAAILVAHPSNYKIVGFTAEPTLEELAGLAQDRGISLLFDQGSGALLDTAPYGLEPEPTVLDGVEAGCDLIAFSGDKLLGGPQSGILVGRSNLIHLAKQHPLARAVRIDKMALAALSTTLRAYLTGRAESEIPIWQMISRPLEDISITAKTWSELLQAQGIDARVLPGFSTVGGGSLPGTKLATSLVAIKQPNIDELAAALRRQPQPVIGRIHEGEFLVDPRTVLPDQGDPLIKSLIRFCD